MAREVQIFWPLTFQEPSACRSARVRIRVVSEPAPGSVTPNAWSRRSPAAIAGRYRRFCSSLPCRSTVPMTYICAWHADGLPPDALISSRMIDASVRLAPPPPYSSGMSAPRKPLSVRAWTKASG